MSQIRFSSRAGIAIGPILFVVAILAILATAIAAGSSTFSSSSETESARTMATALIDQCRTYRAAIDRMILGSGCQPHRLDITPPTFPTGTTWTSGNYTTGNGTNRAGNGMCALYDVRGGTMTFTRLPASAMPSTSTGLFSGIYGDAEMDNWAGYPMLSGTHCITNVGTCVAANSSKKAFLTLSFAPIKQEVCNQINDLLKNNITASTSTININDSAGYNMYTGWGLRPDDGNGAGTSGGITGSTVQEMCARDSRSYINSTTYNANVYYCTLLVR